jgi:hypothetical protein
LKGGLLLDSSNLHLSEDSLYRKKQVIELTSIIKNTFPKQAVSISVISDWGHGKSSFLKFVSDELKKDDDNNIIQIHFNPWISKHSKPVIHIFFDQLFGEITKYDSSIADKIYKYSHDVLTSSADYGMTEKLIKSALNSVLPSHFHNSIQGQKDGINERIALINKKIVVIIDDMDRISGDDIMDIFSLIKNTVDFQNTFFLVALDLDYSKKAIQESYPLLDVGRYLEKIFQLQILLTPILFEEIKNLIKDELQKFLSAQTTEDVGNGIPKFKFDQEFSKEFNQCMDELGYSFEIANLQAGINTAIVPGVLEQSILNIRDIKRFLNSFIMACKLSDGETALKDLILLELLKLKNPDIYSKLATGSFIKTTEKTLKMWDFDDASLTAYFGIKEENLNPTILPINYQLTYNILKRLYSYEFRQMFSNVSGFQEDPRSIAFIENHKKYFNFDLFGDMSIVDFKEARKKGVKSLCDYFEQNICKVNREERHFNAIQNDKASKYFKYLMTGNEPGENELLASVKAISLMDKPFFPQILIVHINFHFYKSYQGNDFLNQIYIDKKLNLIFKNTLYRSMNMVVSANLANGHIKTITSSFFANEVNHFDQNNFVEIILLLQASLKIYPDSSSNVDETVTHYNHFLYFFKKHIGLFLKGIFAPFQPNGILGIHSFILDFAKIVLQNSDGGTISFYELLDLHFKGSKTVEYLMMYHKNNEQSYLEFRIQAEKLNEMLVYDGFGNYEF